MPQGGRGKARKISADTIIDSDHVDHDDFDAAAAVAMPVGNLQVGDAELSDNSLPATVSVDKVQDAPGLRGIKRKISALVPRKQIPATAASAASGSERKHFFF